MRRRPRPRPLPACTSRMFSSPALGIVRSQPRSTCAAQLSYSRCSRSSHSPFSLEAGRFTSALQARRSPLLLYSVIRLIAKLCDSTLHEIRRHSTAVPLVDICVLRCGARRRLQRLTPPHRAYDVSDTRASCKIKLRLFCHSRRLLRHRPSRRRLFSSARDRARVCFFASGGGYWEPQELITQPWPGRIIVTSGSISWPPDTVNRRCKHPD